METKKIGFGIWGAGIVLAIIAVLLALFTAGGSLICCLPAGILMLVGSCIIYADKFVKGAKANEPKTKPVRARPRNVLG